LKAAAEAAFAAIDTSHWLRFALIRRELYLRREGAAQASFIFAAE